MEYKIIIKEQLLNTKVLGGIGKDIIPLLQ